MSNETDKWLNTNTLIGQTSKRGDAWHYRADLQGAESNHYEGFIPVEDLKRRLFHWTPVSAALRARAEILAEDGVTVLDIVDNDRQVIIRPDTKAVLGVFKSGYKIHPYQETLVELTQSAIGDGVGIGSAGLLKGGGQAWVQFEFDGTTDVAGVEFRPFVTASTSLDGSLGSGWTAGAQVVVCDNTLSCALADKSALKLRKKHTANSLNDATLDEIRETLQLKLIETKEAFTLQVERLTNEAVSADEWSKFVDLHFGTIPHEEGASRTKATNRNNGVHALWVSDPRVAPWSGTAFGVVQAVNTWTHHVQGLKGTVRRDQNALRAIQSGANGIDALDAGTLDSLNKVFAQSGRNVLTFA